MSGIVNNYIILIEGGQCGIPLRNVDMFHFEPLDEGMF